MVSARQFTIKGRVQGVFFRDSTRRVAVSLGLSGYAINLDNGDVEVLACGETAAIDELAAWLRDGPRMAEVSAVIARETTLRESNGFKIG